MNKDLKDHGPKPFVVDVEKLTVDNKNYRTVIWTGKYMQMTVMSIPPGEDIGLELHKDHDQFLRIEEGEGIVQMGDTKDNLDFQEKVEDDFAILIPAGKWHNLVNNSTEPLKLYSIYSPVEHPKNTVHKTKQGELTKHSSGGKLNNHTNINMKFNKEKIKKFASGGKSPKEIMAEARRNQAIGWQQQEGISSAIARDAANTAARDAVNNSGIPAYQSQPVIIQAPKPTVDLTLPELTQRSDLKSMFKTRGEAFNYARKQGWSDFAWEGKSFHTRTAEDEAKAATPQTTSQFLTPSGNAQDLITGTGTGTGTASATSGVLNPQWGTFGQFSRTAPRSTSTPIATPTFIPTPASASASATPSSSNWWRRFNENNAARRGEARNRSSRGVPEVLQRAGTVANQLSMRYQQGGTINNSTNSSDELYADFAIRLLSSLGLSENEILVNGELNPQYSEMVINSINEIDTPEFWNAYMQNPDQIVTEYINSKSPQDNMDTETSSAVDENSDIEFARKGAALKQLRKNKKTLTCKCGCKMTSKRKGGKLVTQCSCGCKS